MSAYTVKQLAVLSGVSVRTLHHYDQIGLLKPARLGANGYRYYGRDELLRLQQVLFHRELGFPLNEISRLLDAPDFDRVEALKTQKRKLLADARRRRRLMRTIDETLAALNGETEMNDKALYQGFEPEKQAEYEEWLAARHGEGFRKSLDASKRAMAARSRPEIELLQVEYQAVEDGLADALRQGLPAESAEVQALVRRHHAWVGQMWAKTPSRQGYVGLSQTYAGHPDFVARFEAKAPGLTAYIGQAIQVFAERELA